MNTPNKLTLLRIVLVPFFMFFLLMEAIPCNYLYAVIIFAIASITDMLDGMIARKYNLITDFGKFMDPVADKLLVCGALICFVENGIASSWIVMIVLLREFLVTSIRLVAASSGKVVAANMWGKVKTVMQIVAIIVVCLAYFGQSVGMYDNMLLVDIISQIVLWLSTIMTLISGIVYINDNWHFIKDM